MALRASPAANLPFVVVEKSPFDLKPALAAMGTLLAGALFVRLFPALQLELFARSAAQLVSLLTGAALSRDEVGWIVPLSGAPVAVTIACSATDYFLLVATLLGFQTAHWGIRAWAASGLSLGAALIVTVFVNALRIVTVAYAHPWVISRLPGKYEALLHMAAGAAVFLPSLILLNLLLEIYGRHLRSVART